MNDIIENADWFHWQRKAQALLSSNRIETGEHRYTRPAPTTYEQQWLWDSAFHAIVYRWFDGDMARDELLSAASHQLSSGPDAGMIPHMTYWEGGGRKLWGVEAHSMITQPPLLATAARLVYERTGERRLLEDLYPRLQRYHDWFERRRDPDDDHLVSLIHPWESGWDAAPRWDSLLGLEPFTHDRGKEAREALAARLREHDYDAEALAEAGHFSVEPIDFNAIRAADLEALAFIAAELGETAAAERWQVTMHAVRRAVSEKMFGAQADDMAGDLAGADETFVGLESAAPFIALFGGCATLVQARRLVYRLQEPGFWRTFPVPTTLATSPAYTPDIYWRGNVWLPVNWLIYMGLRRYRYNHLARQLAARSLRLVAENDFWEYFNPDTGKGRGAAHQSWSAIVLDMLGQEQSAERA
ncbi:MAG TPA: trehalase family glycosidase [Candidatus Sulfomarinibacteraceae bacterium]|nr:trehalase family glycosidase [Candidatus Sulfomarinibacteraceae bacterium]